MKPALFFSRSILVAFCLASVGCKEVKVVQAQRDESRAKMNDLSNESRELDEKLAALRGVAPDIGSGEVAQKVAENAETELQRMEQEVLKAAKSYAETVAAHEALEKDLEALRSRR